ncbi:response regulator transcription factor [Deinococcus sedimenti]|uniref:DNA-binding response regulator n=1 Tax=Deinococcus sedimenti TaxID=1867090 RepID=A0ABQ2SBY9_9DEIO|nr:response regulator transcription factor [Deinococcus sedimenti]GGS10041.1 DNA-binding response regulator [Deinococcus sedimenti]
MIRLVLADNQRLFREALTTLLNLQPDLSVIREVACGADALAAVHDVRPDILLADIEMPGLSGLDVAEQLQRTAPATRVVLLTTFGHVTYRERALQAQVSGYLLKDTPARELATALRQVHAGLIVMTAPPHGSGQPCPLTPRERDVLRLAETGTATQDIAAATGLRAGTVRNHLSEIIGKLGVRNRVEAARRARMEGWL